MTMYEYINVHVLGSFDSGVLDTFDCSVLSTFHCGLLGRFVENQVHYTVVYSV